jgi:esterase/lipase
METELIEIKSPEGEILRGILTKPSNSKKAVIMLHGFERNSSAEPKFKKLADKLAKENLISLRFDYSGCGISDGDFRYVTTEKWTSEFNMMKKYLEEKFELESINVITHSFSGCVIANYLKDKNEKMKILLLSPATNQKELLRYWFTQNYMKKENPKKIITWENYKKYFNEKEFEKDCRKEGKMAKANFVNPEYFLSNKEKDYTKYLKKFDKSILHIHGDKDPKVPLEGMTFKFSNSIIVKGGDHDCEKPNTLNQWINQAVDFLK